MNIGQIVAVDQSTLVPMPTINFMKVNGGETLETPCYKRLLDAGMDLRANVFETTTLKPGERMLIGTGIAFEMPDNMYAEVVPRSGLADKYGISIVNSPGTVECTYRGEILVNLINLGTEDFVFERGDRIAQIIFKERRQVRLNEVKQLSDSERGTQGHGSSGVK